MNVYYRITQVGGETTYYELEIPFQSYYISIYTSTTHLPHKRLAKYRPLSYFMIFPGDVLGIIVYPKDGGYHGVKIEKPNREILKKLLIEKISVEYISSVRLREDIKPGDIVNEFLKTLY